VCQLYIELGLYFKQVKPYLDVLIKDQVLIMLYNNLKENVEGFVYRVFRFLDLAPVSAQTGERYNEAMISRYPFINKLIRRLGIPRYFLQTLMRKIRSLLYKRYNLPILTEGDRKQLQGCVAQNIQRLEGLIGRELSG
jgi:hypothetical protein